MSGKPHLTMPNISKMFQPKKPKTDDVREATDSVMDHAKPVNASASTSATTGRAVHTNDQVATTQHHSTMSRWKKVSWNATKLTLELVNQGSVMFPPLQTVAGLLLNLVNRYEVRYPTLSCDSSRTYSSKLTNANKDSIQSVVKRLQYLNGSIVPHGSDSESDEPERQKRLRLFVSSMSCIFLYYLIFDHPVDCQRFLMIYNCF
jgi:hypothetical protein